MMGLKNPFHQFCANFYVSEARRLVKEFVHNCSTYQQNKGEHLHPARLLPPLDVPSVMWPNIAMDFV
jgi:hypothetical protein